MKLVALTDTDESFFRLQNSVFTYHAQIAVYTVLLNLRENNVIIEVSSRYI